MKVLVRNWSLNIIHLIAFIILIHCKMKKKRSKKKRLLLTENVLQDLMCFNLVYVHLLSFCWCSFILNRNKYCALEKCRGSSGHHDAYSFINVVNVSSCVSKKGSQMKKSIFIFSSFLLRCSFSDFPIFRQFGNLVRDLHSSSKRTKKKEKIHLIIGVFLHCQNRKKKIFHVVQTFLLLWQSGRQTQRDWKRERERE